MLFISKELLLNGSPKRFAGSLTINNLRTALHASSGQAREPEIQADRIAQMVGLSVYEVSDLLGSSNSALASVMAGGTASLAHVAKLLVVLTTACGDKSTSARQPKGGSVAGKRVESDVAALTAVLQAEAQKAERALESSIGSLPHLSAAILDTKGSTAILDGTLEHMACVHDVASKVDEKLGELMHELSHASQP
jgi:hypothetical protein